MSELLSSRWGRAIVLLALTMLALLPNWLRQDWDGTEGRRVQIALEMLREGNAMVPLLGGEPTWAKPPLHYWLLMVCAEVFGPHFMMLRLPSVLAVFAAAFVGGELMRRWFGQTAGWLLSAGVICSPFVLFVWPTAEIDPLFATLTAMSLWLLATGVARERRGLVLASGLLAGLAMLQKGPPMFLFAAGAYLVWWRHRRLRYGMLHFVPMLVVVAGYFAPLWLWHVDPGEMLRIANTESVGRMAQFEWKHVYEIPGYWLRAVVMLLPFGFWCFWEWRGPRFAGMGPDDLTLRMCSGGAVLSVVLLTFFPGRPTRYLLPNVLLFTFAVTPAVAHYYHRAGAVMAFARNVFRVLGVGGAIALLVIPFVPRAGVGSLALALGFALSPLLVRTPRHVVHAALLLPLLGAFTVGLERSLDHPDSHRGRVAMGRLLRRELDSLGASGGLGSFGHIDSPTLLATGLWPKGDEFRRWLPDSDWVLHEEHWHPLDSQEHALRLRLQTDFKTFLVSERVR